MKITYIHHSSFLVELTDLVLLFDYFEGDISGLPADKPLYVFASHFHGDHFSPVIFDLAKERADVFYILSKDIKRKQVPDSLAERVHFIRAGEVFKDRQRDLYVEAFHSTDEGVAFWIRSEGLELYHAGDLNNWWWEGEDAAWNQNMAADYAGELDKMAGRTADAAFVPLDPRLGEQFYFGMDEFMRKVSAKAVFPMHFWKDYGIIEKMKKHPCSESYRDKIVEIHREGEVYIR